MPKVLLNEQNSDLQKLPVVSLNTLNTSASNAIGKVTGLSNRSPRLFIRLLQLHRYFLRILYHLCLLWWNMDFSFNSEGQLYLCCRSKVKQIS